MGDRRSHAGVAEEGRIARPRGLRKLQGSRVRVTGWLYYEPDDEQEDPRGTRWEIHPVTAVVAVK